MFRGGNQSMILAIAIMLSALTIFNADRRRSAGVELDYGHHDRLLVDEVNELHVKMMGVPRYGGGDDQRVRFQLRPMLPDSGARFGAAVDFSEFEPLARLHERRKQRLKARATANAAPAAAAAAAPAAAAAAAPAAAAAAAPAATAHAAAAAAPAATADVDDGASAAPPGACTHGRGPDCSACAELKRRHAHATAATAATATSATAAVTARCE